VAATTDDRLYALAETFRAFAEVTPDYRVLLETVAREMTRLIGDGCLVVLAGDDGAWLEAGAVYARDPRGLAALRAAIARPATGGGLSGKVARTGESVLVPRIEPEELARRSESRFADAVRELGIHSFLSVPLEVRGRRLGALSLVRYATESAPFDEDDRVFVRSISDHAALAISNAQLVESLQRALVERHRVESQLQQAQKMEALGRLAGGVAHDFNNLLTVILSYCVLLERALPAGSRLADDVSQIARAGERAAGLTRQLLAFSRKQVMTPQPLDLGATVASMDRMIRSLIGEDIELRIVAPPELGTVVVDAGQIEQVVMNLVVNARDAMRAGGTLTIAADRTVVTDSLAPGLEPGTYAVLSVIDTGIGIDEETRAHVFDPFFTTKEHGKGTGLGLSTVMGIVTQSGGHVTVESGVGHGSTFRVYLPMSGAAIEHAPAIPRTLTPLPAQGRILLVEDEAPVRELVRDVLLRAGYDVLDAADGEQALSIALAAGDLHLLLTDVIMPKMSGPQLAARFLEARPGTPVLFMSGYTDDKLGQHGVLEPGVELVQKPLTPEGLLRRVREVLKSP
jgi:signal transduction histidine kinase/CheY-like chemotaxis protein